MIKKRSIIIGAIALFILAASMIALLLYQPEGKGTGENFSPEVTEFSYQEIASITVQNKEGNFVVLTEGETPVIEGEDASLYNSEGLLALVNVLGNITADKSTQTEAADLVNYGLDDPQATVSIRLKNESVVTLYLGMQNPMDQSWSIKKEDGDQVYTVQEVIGTCMLMGKTNYRDMTLITGANDTAIRQLKHITISRRNGEDTQKIVLEQLPFEKDATLITYKMIEPVISNLNWEIVDNDVINKLNEFKADGVLADDTNFEKYGLANPEYTLELEYTDKTERVFVTSSPDEAYMVAAVEGKNTIYLISSSKAEFLQMDYKSIIGESAYIRNATTVKRLTINTEGKSIDIEVTGDTNTIEPKLKGESVNQNAFMSFYLTATQIPLVRELTPDDPADGRVQMEMVFYLRDGKKDVVELLTLSERQSAVRINGQMSFVTYTKIIDDILNTYQILETK